MLNKKSVELINYFMKNKCIEKNPNINNLPHITKLFKYLLMEMIQAEKYVKKQRRTIQFVESPIHKISDIPKSAIFHQGSTPEKIENYINTHSTHYLRYEFYLFHRKICLYFIVNDSNILKREKYHEYMERIFMWLYILHIHASKNCSTTLNIFIYFTNLEKLLPHPRGENIILDAYNVNTAYTYCCKKNNDIVIFRKEEWFKVFIHETFHSFSLDFSCHNDYVSREKILQLFNINSLVYLFEAYTEFWARMLNAIFISYFLTFHSVEKKTIDKKRLNEYIDKCNMFIYLEQLYSCFQMIKVLEYMSIDYEDLVNFQKNTAVKIQYKENTNVFAYYVLTNILMFYYSDFILWCNKHNTSLFQSSSSNKYQLDFCNFVELHHKKESLLQFIHCLKNTMYLLKKDKISLRNNLRMTICELE